MEFVATAIPDVVRLEPRVFEDGRGFFFESFNDRIFSEIAPGFSFVQDNHSRSARGVLRGLHYQIEPHAQGKIVRAVHGQVFDVAVDIRRNSPTFTQWVGEVLSAENRHQLWIPPGFAHGFLVMSDYAEIVYKTTDYYVPEADRCVAWDAAEFGIDWPLEGGIPILSDKDSNAPDLAGAEISD